MWTVAPKKMLAAMNVLNLVPATTGLPSSAFIRLHAHKKELHLSLNAEIAGSVSIRGHGELDLKAPIYLDRSLFMPFVFGGTKYKGKKPFGFQFKHGKLVVTQGRRKGAFQCAAEGSGYLDVENTSGGTVLPLNAELIGLLKVAAECATKEQTAPELCCVYLKRSHHTLKMFASNQLVIFYASREEKAKLPERLPFPVHLIPFLGAEGVRQMRVREKDVLLDFDCGYVWQPLSVKAEKGFPLDMIEGLTKGRTYKYTDKKGKKLRAYIEPEKGKNVSVSDWPERFKLPAYRLGAVVDRFADYLASAKKEDWVLKISAEKGDKEIVFESLVQQGAFHEKIMMDDSVKESFSLTWPLDILLPVFKYLARDRKTMLSVSFGERRPTC